MTATQPLSILAVKACLALAGLVRLQFSKTTTIKGKQARFVVPYPAR